MRAEELFEAVGGIDDKLIARSDRRVRSSQEKPSSGKAAKRTKKRKSRRSVGAEIYRFTVVAMSTAVVVFLFLMARDLLGIRNLSDIRNRIASTQESSIAEPMQAEEAAAEQAEESAVMRAEEAAEKAEASSDQRDSNEAEAEESSEVAENRAAGSFFGNKTAVDMLGDLKGDYVSLEIISVEDEANGGSRLVPEYTEEGEKALSEAFSKGKPTPKVFAATGEATYYVYLTKKNGEVHRAVFYENAYVSMDNIPGVVMKISQADYEEVKALFR